MRAVHGQHGVCFAETANQNMLQSAQRCGPCGRCSPCRPPPPPPLVLRQLLSSCLWRCTSGRGAAAKESAGAASEGTQLQRAAASMPCTTER